MAGISNFFYKYFVYPYNSGYFEYNLVNTFFYGIFAFFGIYIIYKLLETKKTKLDKKFVLNLLPYLIIASLIRALVDHNQLSKNFFTVSPGIYFSVASLFIIGLLFGKLKFLGISSLSILILSNINLFLSIVQDKLNYLILIIVIMTITYLFTAFYSDYNFIEKFALLSQFFDGINTAFIINMFGGVEKHVIPSFIMDKFGAFSFPIVKLLAMILIINILRKDTTKFEKLILIAIGSLGLAQGLRNLFSLIFI